MALVLNPKHNFASTIILHPSSSLQKILSFHCIPEEFNFHNNCIVPFPRLIVHWKNNLYHHAYNSQFVYRILLSVDEMVHFLWWLCYWEIIELRQLPTRGATALLVYLMGSVVHRWVTNQRLTTRDEHLPRYCIFWCEWLSYSVGIGCEIIHVVVHQHHFSRYASWWCCLFMWFLVLYDFLPEEVNI